MSVNIADKNRDFSGKEKFYQFESNFNFDFSLGYSSVVIHYDFIFCLQKLKVSAMACGSAIGSATQILQGQQDETNGSSDPAKTTSPFAHPVYQKLSLINGSINKMTKLEIQEKLKSLRLDTRYG